MVRDEKRKLGEQLVSDLFIMVHAIDSSHLNKLMVQEFSGSSMFCYFELRNAVCGIKQLCTMLPITNTRT